MNGGERQGIKRKAEGTRDFFHTIHPSRMQTHCLPNGETVSQTDRERRRAKRGHQILEANAPTTETETVPFPVNEAPTAG